MTSYSDAKLTATTCSRLSFLPFRMAQSYRDLQDLRPHARPQRAQSVVDALITPASTYGIGQRDRDRARNLPRHFVGYVRKKSRGWTGRWQRRYLLLTLEGFGQVSRLEYRPEPDSSSSKVVQLHRRPRCRAHIPSRIDDLLRR